MSETAEEFRARMRSVGIVRGGRFRPLEKVVTRSPDGENATDAGRRAKMTISEERDIVTTTSDNRQDVMIFGNPARAGGAGGAQ